MKILNKNHRKKMTKTNVKFISEDKSEFMNELKIKVKNYFETNKITKYGNKNLVVKAIFMVSLYILPYLLMLTGIITSGLGFFLAWIIMGIGMAGVGMGLMHDANHRTFSKNPKVNNFLGKSLYFLGGFPPNWKFQHNNMHHGNTNIEGHDDDITSLKILRFSPHQTYRKIHKFQHFYAWIFYGLMTISWSTSKDFKQLKKYKNSEGYFRKNRKFSKYLLDLIFAKTIYYIVFLIIPLIFFPISWYWTILFYLAMHFVAGSILGIVFQTAHIMPSSEFPLPDENGNIQNDWAIHQLSTTSDYSPENRFFSWLIGGLNFQIEHHLFPNISHVHYRKLSPIVKNTALKYNLPYNIQANFISALANHTKMLKILGEK